MINNRHTLKRAVDDKNLIVYTAFEGNKVTVITEVPELEDIHPDDFQYFIENWAECATKLNPLIEEVKLLDPVNGYGTGRTVAVCPWPMSKRLMYTARYPCINYKPSEHVFLMSSLGAESRSEFTPEDAKIYAMAYLYVAGYLFAPIQNAVSGNIGTRILYV